MFVDSHCHLDYPGLAEREAEVVERASNAGVGFLQTICTKLSAADDVLAITDRHANVSAAIGVHPHHAATDGFTGTESLEAVATHPCVTAIGETGLDYHYEHSPRDVQMRLFRTHIAAARETGLPVIIHTRDADADMAAVLHEEMTAGPFTGVVHCFSSSRALGECAVELGLHLGIGGILTFKRSDDLRAIVRDLPLDRLLLETDAPYLAPPPHRGRANEPAYVPLVAEMLAATRGEPVSVIEEATTTNFFRVFPKATSLAPCG
ncbi:MAG: TatD family hydrolase [Pseudomonadota bacterium]